MNDPSRSFFLLSMAENKSGRFDGEQTLPNLNKNLASDSNFGRLLFQILDFLFKLLTRVTEIPIDYFLGRLFLTDIKKSST